MERDYLIKLTSALYRVTDVLPEKEPLRFGLREKAVEILADGILVLTPSHFSTKNGAGQSGGKAKNEELLCCLLQNCLVLNALFGLAKKQNWVEETNFCILEEEYNKLKATITQALKMAQGQKSLFIKAPAEAKAEEAKKEAGEKLETLKKGDSSPAQPRPFVKGRGWAVQNDRMKVGVNSLKNKRHKQIIKILKERSSAQVKDLLEVFPQLAKRTLRRDMAYLLNLGFVERIGDRNSTLYRLRPNSRALAPVG